MSKERSPSLTHLIYNKNKNGIAFLFSLLLFFSVLFKGSFFACFSLKISPIAPRVPSVSIALDGIKTLFAGPFATSANDSNDL